MAVCGLDLTIFNEESLASEDLAGSELVIASGGGSRSQIGEFFFEDFENFVDLLEER